mmetsp:Transcript_84725/g.220612  ORF Transcript_84725/g.220612 Transcript_84725/m.220612 type:complete len:621 (+) Transcript_84725:112-1974(+)
MAKTSYKFAIATQGTRGDFQPMLSLAIGLRRAGHDVLLMGNEDHMKAASEFNFRCIVCCTEVKDILKGEAGKKAMETGDLVCSFKAIEGDTTEWHQIFKDGLDDWVPDLIVYSALIQGTVEWYVNTYKPDLPMILVAYQPQMVPTNEFAPSALYRVELEKGCPMLTKWVIMGQYWELEAFKAIAAAKENGASQDEIENIHGPESVHMKIWHFEDHCVPTLMAYSAAWWPAPADWPKTGVEIVGRWLIPKEEQEERVKDGGTFFSVGSEQQQCTDFINAGEPPVYIGWGSMTVQSPEHMTILAVSALRIAGRRGIIVAGWADFSSESLDTAPNANELKEFCGTNVLFLKAAPHEWLFPQCVCCVHHGGVGTVQASLGAGSPTIVTPVFADQHDIADHITKNGWGHGTCRLPKLKAEELGAAIKKVAGDKAIKANCVALAEKMAKEDGVGLSVQRLERFMVEDVKTGKWAEKKKAFDDKAKAWRKKNVALNFEKITAQFTMDLNKRYPPLRAWHEKSMEQFSSLFLLAKSKKLYYVKGSSCLARAGEKLKSDEVGRFREYAFVELLEQKGSRLHVKRIKGVGPDEGWVSTEVKGVEIVKECAELDILRLQAEELAKTFADIF